jgi:hypothetical protein
MERKQRRERLKECQATKVFTESKFIRETCRNKKENFFFPIGILSGFFSKIFTF